MDDEFDDYGMRKPSEPIKVPFVEQISTNDICYATIMLPETVKSRRTDNGKLVLEIPSQPISDADNLVLYRLFPTQMHQIERLLAIEALIAVV